MHLEAAAALQGLLQHGQGLGQHIGHAAAHLAVGMGVVAQRVVKAVAGPGDRNLEQLTVLTQQVQVAVYGAQAHFGVLRPHPGIDGIRGGVVIGALNGFQDQLSLTGIFQWDHSLNSNDYLFKDSRKWPVCQCRKPGLRKKYPLR